MADTTAPRVLSWAALFATAALAGCVSDQARIDIARSAATSYNAAAAFQSPAAAAIEANQIAIAHAVGIDLRIVNGSAQDPAATSTTGAKP